MAAALECWSGRASIEEDPVEQVLIRANDTPESSIPAHFLDSSVSSALPSNDTPNPSAKHRRLLKLSRNVSEVFLSFKNSLNIDGNFAPSSEIGTGTRLVEDNLHRKGRVRDTVSNKKFAWGNIVRNLIQLYPGSQLPEKLISNIKKHYDSLPTSYAEVGFDTKEVLLHLKLMEQASVNGQPAILIHKLPEEENHESFFKLTFACNSSISLTVMSSALDNASISCNMIQIFEKKGRTLGVIVLSTQGEQEKLFKTRAESALRYAMKKPKLASVKLSFGLCGCQEETMTRPEACDNEDEANARFPLEKSLLSSYYTVHVDDFRATLCEEDMKKWVISSENLRVVDKIGRHSYKGVYRGRNVLVERMKGLEKGESFTFKIRREMLEIATCGHRNIQQFYGVCLNETYGLTVVTKWSEGGTVKDMMVKRKKLRLKVVVKIAYDVVQGIKFMNDHQVAYSDLNTSRILLDENGNGLLAEPGVVRCGETVEYETDGYRWLAPEVIAGDPESVKETWMSNAYSLGMVVWEMVTGKAAYGGYSPVQAAVGIAACGLRPDIPADCPKVLESLMKMCWATDPSARPRFDHILSLLSDAISSFPIPV